ncbi:MAG: AAA family ATPase [Bacilli bacterium]|nr:AAA family ATPase [Bacilli bacterium]
MEYNEIYNQLINEIPLNKSENVYGILFIAGPGFGKSTITKMLSSKLNLFIASNDAVRRLFNENNDVPETKELVVKLVIDRLHYLLENKICHIIDGDSEFYYDEYKRIYNSYNAKMIVIKLECSEETILKRLDNRALSFGKSDNKSRATREDYYIYLDKLKKNTNTIDNNYYVINTDTSYEEIEKQVDEFINKNML